MCLPGTAGGESQHAKAGEGVAEEAESGAEGEDPPAERAQQGGPGTQQTGESLQGTSAP